MRDPVDRLHRAYEETASEIVLTTGEKDESHLTQCDRVL